MTFRFDQPPGLRKGEGADGELLNRFFGGLQQQNAFRWNRTQFSASNKGDRCWELSGGANLTDSIRMIAKMPVTGRRQNQVNSVEQGTAVTEGREISLVPRKFRSWVLWNDWNWRSGFGDPSGKRSTVTVFKKNSGTRIPTRPRNSYHKTIEISGSKDKSSRFGLGGIS
jgi:hypothetical protein